MDIGAYHTADNDTNGGSDSPKDSSGSIHANTGPTQMPKLSSSKIEGRPAPHTDSGPPSPEITRVRCIGIYTAARVVPRSPGPGSLSWYTPLRMTLQSVRRTRAGR